uniref:Uncharacterized protein n=1 Tax=Anopheles coluzzii TaxID=1518534 RepID=A0A8W7PDP4_ANOCL
MRTRLASLIVVKQEPLSATSPPPPTPHASAHPLSGASFSSPSLSSSSSSSSCSSASSSSSPPSSLFRSSLVVADGCDGLQCYGSFGPAASAVELKHPGQPRVADGVVVVVQHQQQQSAPHADLVAQYFCDRNGHGYGAHANGSGGDLNNNDPSSEQFEFFDEKKSLYQPPNRTNSGPIVCPQIASSSDAAKTPTRSRERAAPFVIINDAQ